MRSDAGTDGESGPVDDEAAAVARVEAALARLAEKHARRRTFAADDEEGQTR